MKKLIYIIIISLQFLGCEKENDCECESLYSEEWQMSFEFDCQALEVYSNSISNGKIKEGISLNTLEIIESRSNCR